MKTGSTSATVETSSELGSASASASYSADNLVCRNIRCGHSKSSHVLFGMQNQVTNEFYVAQVVPPIQVTSSVATLPSSLPINRQLQVVTAKIH